MDTSDFKMTLAISDDLNGAIASAANELSITKSAFIRESIDRNLEYYVRCERKWVLLIKEQAEAMFGVSVNVADDL
jgi:predicted transcriptional regulator